MSQKNNSKPDETPEDYYGELQNKWKRLRNKECLESYGINTEPKQGRPRHTTLLTTKRFQKIQLDFLARLRQDILTNAGFYWVYGTPLQGEKQRKQPLGDQPSK